jgi:hypothetical protein
MIISNQLVYFCIIHAKISKSHEIEVVSEKMQKLEKGPKENL